MTKTKSTDGWELQESGWWTHEDHGGIVKAHGSWWIWRKGMAGSNPGEGPFKTMSEAMEAVKLCSWCEGQREPGELCACIEVEKCPSCKGKSVIRGTGCVQCGGAGSVQVAP